MIKEISNHIKSVLTNFSEEDSLIFNNLLYNINKDYFTSIFPDNESKTIAFIDGGQAEIISTGNFSLSFIRVAAILFKGKEKINTSKNEFYLFTTSVWQENEIWFESKIFSLQEKVIDEKDLFISSNDTSLKNGLERASISKIADMARRFAELSLAKQMQADFILLDGTLEKTFNHEERYLSQLPLNASSLAKTSSLFTTQGNSPITLLNKMGFHGCWQYLVDRNAFFVKLHPKARHVFRLEGNKDILPYLLEQSTDALFLGYPYGLILADALARVSNQEKNSLQMKFLLREDNKEIMNYLQTLNAHEILDNLG